MLFHFLLRLFPRFLVTHLRTEKGQCPRFAVVVVVICDSLMASQSVAVHRQMSVPNALLLKCCTCAERRPDRVHGSGANLRRKCTEFQPILIPSCEKVLPSNNHSLTSHRKQTGEKKPQQKLTLLLSSTEYFRFAADQKRRGIGTDPSSTRGKTETDSGHSIISFSFDQSST